MKSKCCSTKCINAENTHILKKKNIKVAHLDDHNSLLSDLMSSLRFFLVASSPVNPRISELMLYNETIKNHVKHVFNLFRALTFVV